MSEKYVCKDNTGTVLVSWNGTAWSNYQMGDKNPRVAEVEGPGQYDLITLGNKDEVVVWGYTFAQATTDPPSRTNLFSDDYWAGVFNDEVTLTFVSCTLKNVNLDGFAVYGGLVNRYKVHTVETIDVTADSSHSIVHIVTAESPDEYPAWEAQEHPEYGAKKLHQMNYDISGIPEPELTRLDRRDLPLDTKEAEEADAATVLAVYRELPEEKQGTWREADPQLAYYLKIAEIVNEG